MRTFVALDLETTGLDPETEEIFELAAVKFRGEEVLDTFHSLVNPQRRLPPRVRILCGISQREVDVAPSFSGLAGKLVSFLGDLPLVGHKISFDLDFLKKRGVSPRGPAYDTLELVRIFLPRLPERNLFFIASYLEAPHLPAHRSLDDALATKEIFTILWKIISKLDDSIFGELLHLSSKADAWLGDLLREIAQERGESLTFAQMPSPSHFAPVESLHPSPEKKSLKIKELNSFFRPGGPLARVFSQYEYRPEQVKMMQQVAYSLNEGHQLLVEAGTGVGKSLAYLLPAAIFARQNDTPIVISTNTINLQEQLMSKDIPGVLQVLEREGLGKLRTVTVKGRSNYLCPRRLSLLRSDDLSPDLARLLMKIRVWLPTTQTGDRSELNLSPRELKLWEWVCAKVEGCPGKKCPFYESCFLFQARWLAAGAHLIVVNHALLFSEMVAGAQVLPEHNYLIIDEAHHLEDEATKQLGQKFSEQDFLDYLQSFLAFLPKLERLVPASRKGDSQQAVQNLRLQVEKTRLATEKFFQHLEGLFGEAEEHESELRLSREIRAKPAWSKVQGVTEGLKLELEKLSKGLDWLYNLLEELEELGGEASPEDLKLEILTLWGTERELEQGLNLFFHPRSNQINWLSSRKDGEISFCSAPLWVGEFLEKFLFFPKETVILTGATLSLKGNFRHFRERVGLKETDELLLGSPFDYRRCALIYIPQDIPEPGKAGYQEAVERVLLSLCRTIRGKTLVLFTSYAQLHTTLEALGPPLEEEGVLVLAQGVDGSPRQLLSVLVSNPKTVLLGTASFWEGVDVVGEALSVLVMMRLPFNVPNEPVFAARSETFKNPFNDYALPQAAFRFKQGFGRMIRSKNDRGVMVVLDSRLNSREYGPYLLSCLPPCRVERGSSRGLPPAVKEWLGV